MTADGATSADVIEAVLAVANAGSTSELKRLIWARRETLFSDAADQVFEGLISQHRDNEEALAHLRGRRTLVAMCREHGIDAAFNSDAAEPALDQLVMTFLNTRDMGELKAFVVGHATELLAPQTDRVFRQLAIQYRDDAAIISFLEERRQLLANCRDHGIDRAFSPNVVEVSEALGNAVAAFLQAASNAQLSVILTRDGHHLLTDEAEQLISFIQGGIVTNDSGHVAHLGRRLALLRRCRLYGVEAALDVSPIAAALGLQPVEGHDPRPASAEQSAVLVEELRALGEADGSIDEAALKALLERRPEQADALFHAIERGDVQWTPPADRRSLETMIADMRTAELSGDWDRVVASGALALQYSAVDQDPRAAAMVHATLGTALSKIQRGDRAANLDRSIHHHRQARAGLQVGETDPARAIWAMNEHHLALALFQRVRGDRAQNVEDAIGIWRGLLAAVGSAARIEWKVSLANALRMRHLGDRVKNIAEAFELLSAAVAAAESEGGPTILAHARITLGLVSLVRPDGDPAANVERAIGYIVSGLKQIDPQSDIASWANVQRSLARAYTLRVFGDPAKNRRTAAEILDKVAAACPADQYPELWAEARFEMGALLSDGPEGRTLEKTREAVRAMESALDVYTRADFPDRWAKVHCNLGSMLVSLFEATENVEIFDRARHHAELSLTVNSREGSPEGWATAHQTLGRLHMRLTELSEGGSRDEAASVALQHFERALEARTIAVDPARRLDTLKRAAAIRFRHRAWDEALALYVDAMRTSDRLLGSAFTEDARLAGVSPGTGLYRSAAYCLEKLNDPTAALICLDWGKGRMLAEALAVQNLGRFHLSAAERDEIALLRGKVRRLEYVMRSAGDASPQEYSELSEELGSARATLNQTVAAATMASDLFSQTRLTPEQLFGCVPATGALVVPLLTAVGTTVFLLVRTKAGEIEMIRLALGDDTSPILRHLVRGGPDGPGWWDQNNAWRRGEISASTWGDTIASTMDAIWKLVLQPVVETLDSRLPPDALVIVAPQGDLAFLPFHAAGAADHGQVGLLDRFTVAYTPSLYALHTCQQRLASRGKTKMKVVAAVNPTRDLPFSDAEADDLRAILPPEDLAVLRGPDAAKAEVQALVGSATHLHLACHGQHDPMDIMQSGLVLSDGVLTLNSILGDTLDLTCLRLVMLSACDTGLNEMKDTPDEFIGLPAAFLEGGACGVLSTLWPVADRATSLLVRRFYQAHLIEGLAPAQALRSAQLWLKSATVSELAEFHLSQEGADTLQRQEAFLELTLGGDANERPYQAPYYWGAFQYAGV